MQTNWPFKRTGCLAQATKTVLVALPALVWVPNVQTDGQAVATIVLLIPATMVWLWAVNKMSGWITRRV